MSRRSCFLVFVALLSLLAVSGSKTPRFGDLYDCYIIADVEASLYEDDNFYLVDSEEVMTIVEHARKGYLEFVPRYQLNLYDDEGIRYVIYLSRTCTLLRIDSNCFRFSARHARRLRRLLSFL